MAGFVGCTNSEENSDGITVTTTVYSVYDWVKEITRGVDNVKIELLIDNGADIHNYQPTANDIVKISNSDLFLYIGGESDKWVSDILAQTTGNVTAIKLIDRVEATCSVDAHRHDSLHSHTEDEHIWLSLDFAKTLCEVICQSITDVDADNKEIYSKNLDGYIQKLTELDSKYSSAVDEAEVKTLIFADRFPFYYLAHDYGIEYYAAFSGCSSESDASFETIAQLAKKMDEHSLLHIFKIDGSDNKLANTVIDSTKLKSAKILTLNSLQTASDLSYLAVMESNLEVLKEAFKETA